MRKAEVDRESDSIVLVQGNLRRLPEGVHSEEVRRAAIALFEEGLGYKSTARKLELKESTVRDWARQWRRGLFAAKPALSAYRITAATKRRIQVMYAAGANLREISRLTGVSTTTCRKICQSVLKAEAT